MQSASTILPARNVSLTPSYDVPWYTVGVLNRTVPSTESRTGAVKTSPSGMFISPAQGTTGMPSIENRRSVSGPVMCTCFARSIMATSGTSALAILA